MCIVNAGVCFDASPSVTLSKLFFSMAYPVAETVVLHRSLPTVASNEKVDHIDPRCPASIKQSQGKRALKKVSNTRRLYF